MSFSLDKLRESKELLKRQFEADPQWIERPRFSAEDMMMMGEAILAPSARIRCSVC